MRKLVLFCLDEHTHLTVVLRASVYCVRVSQSVQSLSRVRLFATP